SARIPAARSCAAIRWYLPRLPTSRSSTSTTTGPAPSATSSLPRFFSADISRETPIEKPVAGTGSPPAGDTRPPQRAPRGHRLASDARHRPVIAAAAPDRAEAHDPALLVGDLGQQLHLVDRARIVF